MDVRSIPFAAAYDEERALRLIRETPMDELWRRHKAIRECVSSLWADRKLLGIYELEQEQMFGDLVENYVPTIRARRDDLEPFGRLGVLYGNSMHPDLNKPRKLRRIGLGEILAQIPSAIISVTKGYEVLGNNSSTRYPGYSAKGVVLYKSIGTPVVIEGN